MLFWLGAAMLQACSEGTSPPAADLLAQPWETIEQQARGQTVHLRMWSGDPLINSYMNGFVAPRLLERHGITLDIAGGQGNQIVTQLMTELEAKKRQSELDVMWINGETFYQLRQIDALFGPFTDKLPNAQFIDFENPFIKLDFQQPVNGYECPWGNVQLALIYDSKRVTSPPRNRRELAEYVKAHPGKFTFDSSFTGMTFLKSLLIDIAGGPAQFSWTFDEASYAQSSALLWQYIEELQPSLWKHGETFPESVAQLHQLYASGEVDFTMSNNDGEVDNKVIQGIFPESSRAYVLDGGTIQNSHFLGIAKHAPHLAGALVAINFLISPEAQYEKLRPQVWGDGTILDPSKLPVEWKAKFENVPERKLAPKRSEIQPKALMEPDSKYMIRLYDDFRKKIIEKN